MTSITIERKNGAFVMFPGIEIKDFEGDGYVHFGSRGSFEQIHFKNDNPPLVYNDRRIHDCHLVKIYHPSSTEYFYVFAKPFVKFDTRTLVLIKDVDNVILKRTAKIEHWRERYYFVILQPLDTIIIEQDGELTEVVNPVPERSKRS